MPQHDHDVGSVSEFQGQPIRQVEIDGAPVLLVRDSDPIRNSQPPPLDRYGERRATRSPAGVVSAFRMLIP
ncbi:MAG: hypothetical protein ACJ8AW_08050, partial [Rhodopila sp.]